METLKAVLGALIVEPVILIVGWLLYDRVAPLASFAFAAGVLAVAVLALRRGTRRATSVGIWALLGGLMLLVVNGVVLL
jgi:hypothetical protein